MADPRKSARSRGWKTKSRGRRLRVSYLGLLLLGTLDGGCDLHVMGIGEQRPRLQQGPDLYFADPDCGQIGGKLDSLVQIAGFQDREASQELLGLCERAIRDRDLAVLRGQRRRG